MSLPTPDEARTEIERLRSRQIEKAHAAGYVEGLRAGFDMAVEGMEPLVRRLEAAARHYPTSKPSRGLQARLREAGLS